MRDCRSYYAPGPEAGSWGLTVTGCGSTRIPPRARYPLLDHPPDRDRSWEAGRVLPLWQIVLITAGRGELESPASGRVAVIAPCAFVLFPHLRHRYRPDRGRGWDEWWLEARGPALDDLRRRGELDPRTPVLSIADPARLRARWESLLDIAGEATFARERRASMACLIASELAASARHDGECHPHGDAVARACTMMDARIDQRTDQRRLAHEVGLAYGTYRRAFLRATGQAPHQHLLGRRLGLARELLLTTGLTVALIAQRCGFSSPFYFSRQFRARYGAPPTRFRDTIGAPGAPSRPRGRSGSGAFEGAPKAPSG